MSLFCYFSHIHFFYAFSTRNLLVAMPSTIPPFSLTSTATIILLLFEIVSLKPYNTFINIILNAILLWRKKKRTEIIALYELLSDMLFELNKKKVSENSNEKNFVIYELLQMDNCSNNSSSFWGKIWKLVNFFFETLMIRCILSLHRPFVWTLSAQRTTFTLRSKHLEKYVE